MPDTPTRRLDDVPNDPPSAACAKCGGSVIWAQTRVQPTNMLYATRLYVEQPKNLFAKRSLCNALVCTECGYTEFYTATPKKLLE